MSFLTDLLDASWVVWFLIIALIVFIIWLFVGGGDYEYVGLAPMKVGVDSSKYLDEQMYPIIERGNYHADKVTGIDITPKIPTAVEPPQPENNSIFVSPSIETNNNLSNISSDISSNLTPIPFIPPCDPFVAPAKRTKKCSKGEQKCRDVIENIYQKEFPCVRPNFLKNPETKRNLELDCYNEELKIAVEYNGIQHYKWPNFTNQSKEDFIKQVRRDKFKVDTCDQNGVYLITVPYNIPHHKIEKYIRYYLPENYHKRIENEKNPNQMYEYITDGYMTNEYDLEESIISYSYYSDDDDSNNDSDGDDSDDDNSDDSDDNIDEVSYVQ